MFHPVVQKTIIAYFLKAGRQHMHQVTADKFRVFQGDPAFWFTGLFPPCRESNRIFCQAKDPAVRNGDFVGITAKVFYGIAKAVKGFLNVRTPVFFIKVIFPVLPVVRVPELFAGRRKEKGAIFIKGIKQRHIFAFEFIPQDF